MKKRDVVKSMGLIYLHALYPSVLSNFFSSCISGERIHKELVFFQSEEQETITEAIALMLPEFNTKADSQAGILFFLDEVFASCLNVQQQALMKKGLHDFVSSWKEEPDKPGLLNSLDKKACLGELEAVWFKTLKQYTFIGFFTSKEGSAGSSRKVPDSFIGEMDTEEYALAKSL